MCSVALEQDSGQLFFLGTRSFISFVLMPAEQPGVAKRGDKEVPRDLESSKNCVIQSRKYSFTHLFNPYRLSAYCVPGLLLDAGNTVVNKIDKSP